MQHITHTNPQHLQYTQLFLVLFTVLALHQYLTPVPLRTLCSLHLDMFYLAGIGIASPPAPEGWDRDVGNIHTTLEVIGNIILIMSTTLPSSRLRIKALLFLLVI